MTTWIRRAAVEAALAFATVTVCVLWAVPVAAQESEETRNRAPQWGGPNAVGNLLRDDAAVDRPSLFDNYFDWKAELVEKHLRELGIDLLLNARLVEIEGNDGRVAGVRLEDGTRIPAEAVLSAVGVKPIVDYASRLGVETTRLGIKVDEYFRTNVPDVYAMGDCITTRCVVTGREVPGKLGSNAGQMARYLGLNLTGARRPYPGVVNAAVTMIEGLAYGAAGLSEKDAADAGIAVEISRNTSSYPYDNMPHSEPVEVKVLYRAEDLTLIGAEIAGRLNPAGFVEVAACLIEKRAKLEDVIRMSYSSHPELTPKTSKPYWVWASEPLFFRLAKKGKARSTS